MNRQKLTLEIPDEALRKFHLIQNALDHDDPEETMEVLVRLGEAAITLTSKDQPEVRLYTRGNKTGNQTPPVKCPSCQAEFSPVTTSNDGFRETAVRLK